MTDPEILDRILENCSFRFRNVVCPNKDKIAKITAAKFQGEDADWSVVECSLLPSGEIKCAMTCLLRNFETSR
ncbi:MAG TPA: hypothetical protein VEI54_08935 [Candidatus Limnocylindrales bacterium]|nr:hypothetical protein [Candidatus Limnocylindrales bacterium]